LLLYRINESLWEAMLFGWLGLAPEERLSETLRFFFYDSIKIALLLSSIIFLVTVLRSYLSVERTRALLAGRRRGSATCWPACSGWSHPSAPAVRCQPSSVSWQRASPWGSR
jgi:hypothetical protein